MIGPEKADAMQKAYPMIPTEFCDKMLSSATGLLILDGDLDEDLKMAGFKHGLRLLDF
jgi:hypothetical protein